eukprot:superscaffoldBa00001567_g11121
METQFITEEEDPEITLVLEPSDSEQDSVVSENEEDTNTEDDVLDSESTEHSSDESSEDRTENGECMEEKEDPGWKSRNGQIVWSPSHAETLRYFPATALTPGPTRYAIARISNVKSCFDLLITEEITQLLVDMTNLQGRRTVKDWKDVDATDLQAYMGLLILAGVHRSRNESTHSLWDDHTGRAIFRATMSHCKFRLLSSCLRFDDRMTRPERNKKDKLAAFRTIWEKWTRRLPLLFNPGRDVCVDEQLVPFKGSCRFRQYMPQKQAKYGLKIWVTCDVKTSYAWKMQIYTGKSDGGAPEVDQGKRVVLEMTEGLKGSTVTCDNFFTSYALAEELLKRKIALVGTVRKTKTELPPQLLQTRQRAPLSSLFAFTRTHTAVSYIPKRGKIVLLLSTKHREPAVSDTEKKKPTIFTDYNRCKGGVDNMDKLVSIYSCRKKTCRWPMVLFYNMLDVSAHNAFVLWTSVDSSWNQAKKFRRRLFLDELGKMLVSPQMARRQRLPHTPAAAAMVARLRQQDTDPDPDSDNNPKKRRLCELCTGKRKKTATTCIKCGKCACKDHTSFICSTCYKLK